jgi:hypothetical protein
MVITKIKSLGDNGAKTPWFSANFLMEDVFPELEIPSTTITFLNANTL